MNLLDVVNVINHLKNGVATFLNDLFYSRPRIFYLERQTDRQTDRTKKVKHLRPDVMAQSYKSVQGSED